MCINTPNTSDRRNMSNSVTKTTYKNIISSKPVLGNCNGGFYSPGMTFSDEKWIEIINIYEEEIGGNELCSSRRLAKKAKISNKSARKAIDFYFSGEIVQPIKGHRYQGVGSITGLEMHHHTFIYNLYLEKPSLPSTSSAYEFYVKFKIQLSHFFSKMV